MASVDISVVSGVPINLGLQYGDDVQLTINSGATSYVTVSPVGVQGPSGPITGVPTFIQSGAPSPAQYAGYAKYAWWQTASGNLTLWIQDGL